jgi:hypothetical protein
MTIRQKTFEATADVTPPKYGWPQTFVPAPRV